MNNKPNVVYLKTVKNERYRKNNYVFRPGRTCKIVRDEGDTLFVKYPFGFPLYGEHNRDMPLQKDEWQSSPLSDVQITNIELATPDSELTLIYFKENVGSVKAGEPCILRNSKCIYGYFEYSSLKNPKESMSANNIDYFDYNEHQAQKKQQDKEAKEKKDKEEQERQIKLKKQIEEKLKNPKIENNIDQLEKYDIPILAKIFIKNCITLNQMTRAFKTVLSVKKDIIDNHNDYFHNGGCENQIEHALLYLHNLNLLKPTILILDEYPCIKQLFKDATNEMNLTPVCHNEKKRKPKKPIDMPFLEEQIECLKNPSLSGINLNNLQDYHIPILSLVIERNTIGGVATIKGSLKLAASFLEKDIKTLDNIINKGTIDSIITTLWNDARELLDAWIYLRALQGYSWAKQLILGTDAPFLLKSTVSDIASYDGNLGPCNFNCNISCLNNIVSRNNVTRNDANLAYEASLTCDWRLDSYKYLEHSKSDENYLYEMLRTLNKKQQLIAWLHVLAYGETFGLSQNYAFAECQLRNFLGQDYSMPQIDDKPVIIPKNEPLPSRDSFNQKVCYKVKDESMQLLVRDILQSVSLDKLNFYNKQAFPVISSGILPEIHVRSGLNYLEARYKLVDFLYELAEVHKVNYATIVLHNFLKS